MNTGLSENTLKSIRDTFSAHPEIDEAILYGSRATGNFRSSSDIDLTLKGKDLDLSLLHKIEDELDELLLPYKIDLSIFHYITQSELIAQIGRKGKSICRKEETLKPEPSH